MQRLTFVTLCVAAVAVSAAALPARSQTVANGPYYAMPAWDQTLPAAQRFIVLANFNSEAVLDRETGLVWERSPAATAYQQQPPAGTFGGTYADDRCHFVQTGGRLGWRLPSVAELSSLVDPTRSAPALPVGHPFNLPVSDGFWTSTRYYPERFAQGRRTVDITYGLSGAVDGNSASKQVWCVRGGAEVSR